MKKIELEKFECKGVIGFILSTDYGKYMLTATSSQVHKFMYLGDLDKEFVISYAGTYDGDELLSLTLKGIYNTIVEVMEAYDESVDYNYLQEIISTFKEMYKDYLV